MMLTVLTTVILYSTEGYKGQSLVTSCNSVTQFQWISNLIPPIPDVMLL